MAIVSPEAKEMIQNRYNFAYEKIMGFDLVRREFRYSEATKLQKESYRQSKVTYKRGALAITPDTEKESMLVGDFAIDGSIYDTIEYLESAGNKLIRIL